MKGPRALLFPVFGYGAKSARRRRMRGVKIQEGFKANLMNGVRYPVGNQPSRHRPKAVYTTQKAGTFVTEPETPPIDDRLHISFVAELVEFTPAHGAEGTVRGLAIGSMIRKTEVMPDLVQRNL